MTTGQPPPPGYPQGPSGAAAAAALGEGENVATQWNYDTLQPPPPPPQQQQSQQGQPQPQATPAQAYPPITYPPYPPTPSYVPEGQAATGYPPAGAGGYPPVPPGAASGTPAYPHITPGTGQQTIGQQQQQQQQYSYPPAQHPQQPQPQQQPHPQPVWGVPVLGQSVEYLNGHPMWGQDDDTRDWRFACCAWTMFVLGFFFPIFWLVSVLLPCCLPGRNVRWAAVASFLAATAYIVVAIVLGIVGHNMRSSNMHSG